MTASELFSKHLNLSDTLPFIFFAGLEDYVWEDPSIPQLQRSLIRGKLQELSKDYNEYKEYIKDYRRNFKEFVEDFPNLKISLDYFLAHIN